MAADLIKMVEAMRDDLKVEYLKDPSAIWDLPIVAFSRKAGGVQILDGIRGDDHVMDWLRTHLQNEVESICVGRMLAKYSDVLDADGKPIIKERAIMIMGKTLDTDRTYVSITPIMEHRDYRRDQVAEEQNKKFDPTLKAPDKTTNILNPYTGKTIGRLQAKFGKEQVMDSKKGHMFLADPIIAGVFPPKRGVEEAQQKAEDLNAQTIDKAKGL